MVQTIAPLRKRWGGVGDVVVVAVKKGVRRGEVQRAVVVRCKKEPGKRWDDNACVLISKDGNMLGSRVLGVVSSGLRANGKWSKIISLAPQVI